MPIFAALTGRSSPSTMGSSDERVTNQVGRRANYVTLQHAGTHRTDYIHFKRNSITVSVGQTAAAGIQLGLTGSSGNSAWPHLHLTSIIDGAAVEPRAGPCRPGSSGALAYETYILLANPSSTSASVTLAFLREGSAPLTLSKTVPANGRLTVSAGEVALTSGEKFGVRIDSSQPIAVDRAMYWNGGSQFWGAGTNETGVRIR